MPRRHDLRHNPRASRVTRVVQLFGVASIALVAAALARAPRALEAYSADPTFAEHVAPILYSNCTSCHHTGGLGPFSLVEYDSAKANLSDIRDMVSTNQMPPWHAVGAHDVFRNDRRLSDKDKATILQWIDAGAPSGDLKKLPARPEYKSGWEIGTPDAIVSMPEDFVVPASGTVEYQYFTAPTGLTEDKWVTAIEILPGAREVVHHVLVYANVPPDPNMDAAAATAARRAAAGRSPLVPNRDNGLPDDPPRKDTLHAPPPRMGALIGTTAPGTNMLVFPEGTALRLRAGTILTFQMHYTAKGHQMHDRTKVGFKFAKEMPEQEIFSAQFVNGMFKIPAGAKDFAVPADIGFNQPVQVWALFPHTHLRGVRWKYTLEKPDGSSAVILDVPNYDFNWQTYYMYQKPLELPAGSRIRSTAWYDNSASNPSNPDATKDVTWGDQTWEEMQYTGFLYTIPARRLRAAPSNNH